MKKFLACLALLPAALAIVGCSKPDPVAEYEPNYVLAHGMELPDAALAQTQTVLLEYFGTPDEPTLPEFLKEDEDFMSLISMDNIHRAAGPANAEGSGGLYRTHCATCHGIVGNGRGETAALLEPYPRDYRHGQFKYKSTDLNAKPTQEDMERIIREGVGGTSMKSIAELAGPDVTITDEDIAALADYVVYLSLRGELERMLLMEAEYLDFEDGEALYDPTKEDFEDQVDFIQELTEDIAANWAGAEDRVQEVPEIPESFPVPDTTAEVLAAAGSDEPSPLKESIAKGKEIFASQAASCGKCHGPEGYGDGQTQDFDDWTKDWTTRLGFDPNNADEMVPLMARGALPPRKILPRDFREGVFRGGDRPEDLYRRIAYGIAGTPMPSAALQPEQIWHLVNYVRSMKTPETDGELASMQGQPTKAAAEQDSPQTEQAL